MGGFQNTLGLYFEIAADPSKGQKAVEDFASSVEKSLGAAKGSFGLITSDIEEKFKLSQGSIARTGVAAQAAAKDLAYLAAGAGALTAAALGLAKQWADTGTEIFEANEKTGFAIQKLSGLHATAKLLGESTQTLDLTLVRLGRNIEAGLRSPAGEAGKTLQSLFKNTEELRTLGLKPTEDQVALVTKKIFELNSTSQQNIVLTGLAGRGYNEVRSTLKELGTGGYDPLIEKAKQLGLFYTPEEAAKARAFVAEMKAMRLEMAALGMTIGREAVPFFEQFFIRLENGKLFLRQFGLELAKLAAIAAAPLTFGTSLLTIPTIINKEIEKSAKEMDQAITDGLVRFAKLAEFAGVGAGKLGTHTKAVKENTEALRLQREHMQAEIASATAAESSYKQLYLALNPIPSALEHYITVEEQLQKVTDGATRSMLHQMNVALQQREADKELLSGQVAVDDAIRKALPSWDAYSYALGATTAAQMSLSDAQRAALPLVFDQSNALAGMLASSRAAIDQMLSQELPARQRIEIEIDRQRELARQELAEYQVLAAEKKITMAELQAAEAQYSAVSISLDRQRALAKRQATIVEVQATVAAGAALLSTLGYYRVAAGVLAVWKPRKRFELLLTSIFGLACSIPWLLRPTR